MTTRFFPHFLDPPQTDRSKNRARSARTWLSSQLPTIFILFSNNCCTLLTRAFSVNFGGLRPSRIARAIFVGDCVLSTSEVLLILYRRSIVSSFTIKSLNKFHQKIFFLRSNSDKMAARRSVTCRTTRHRITRRRCYHVSELALKYREDHSQSQDQSPNQN